MPIDPNEAPEGFYAVASLSCDGCDLRKNETCRPRPLNAFCGSLIRKDGECVIFKKKPQPTEAKTMEDEYEYLVADSVENCKTLADWFFNTSGEIIYYLSDSRWSVAPGIFMNSHYRRKKPQTDVLIFDLDDAILGVEENVVQYSPRHNGNVGEWVEIIKGSDIARLLSSGFIRLKPGCKLPPKKVKKLVPRTAEELTQLIGKCLIRMKTTPGIVHLLIDNDYEGDQEHWEMCHIGECVWGPMMKESGV